MVFADLQLLWVLGPLFVVWAALWWMAPTVQRRHRRRAAALRFSNLDLLKRIGPSRSLRLRKAVQALRLLSVVLLVLAMARPQTGERLTEVNTQGVDIVLVVDTSGSMRALDLDADRPIAKRRDRLEVAKEVVDRFIARRETDQVGLVVFGENAFTQCPLTLDHTVVGTLLERLEIGMAGNATAIGDAVGTAVKRLRDSKARSKVIILLTDGRSNAGAIPPLKAAEIAATFDIRLYAVGVGTRGPAPFPVETAFGRRIVQQNVEIDEETLERMAEATGGAYFRAEDREGLEAVYGRIDEMEKTEISMTSYMEYEEQYRWFVIPATILLLLEVVLLGTRFRRLP